MNTIAVPALPATAHRPPTIRVLLADDHAVTLWGLRQLVDSCYPRMSVSGTATSCSELISHPALAQTDVVLLDLSLRDASAIDCVPRLVSDAGVQVVVLTGDLNPSHHRDAVLRGARGIVLKSQPTQAVLEAVERVHAGEVCFDGSLMSMLLDSVPGMARSPQSPAREAAHDSLTPKEREVVRAVVKYRGAKGLAVADALGISEHTLRNHLTVIYSKLGVQGKLDLYAYALEHDMVDARHDRDDKPRGNGRGDGLAR
jgi:DNA-binding NarL/FixJ family response regulator